MLKLFMFTALAFFISGCALATPYQPFNIFGTGGYENKEIDSNTQMVTYYTNMVTDSKIHKTMLLYRCAEVTIEKGYDYFDVLHEFGQKSMNKPSFVTMQYGIKMYKGQPRELLEGMYIAKKVIESSRHIIEKQN